MNQQTFTGAYTNLDDLLKLRYRRLRSRATDHGVTSHSSGLRLSRLRGRGVDFSEVRLYQPGDDVRTIDWRVTARKAKPHTKVFREERERPVFLLADQSQSMFFGSQIRLKSVAAAELTGLLAWQALQKGDRVGGLILSNTHAYRVKPYRSTRSVIRLLTKLADSNCMLNRDVPETWLKIDTGLMQLVKLAHTGHRIYIISDFKEPFDKWKKSIHRLARHNDLVLVQVSDPMEEELPPAGMYTVTDGRRRLQLSTADRKNRALYRERFLQRQDQLSKLAANAGAMFLPLSTTDDPEMVLRSRLKVL